MDGFSPKHGWIKIDLRYLYHVHRTHEIKRKRVQSKASKKPSLKHIVSKHGERERNRARDFIHKLTTQLAKVFPNVEHGFEDLEKQGMYNKRINIYLRMCGFPLSPSTFYRVVIKRMIPLWKVRMKRGRGVTTKGGKGNDKPLMNPRGGLSPMNPKAYIDLPIPT